MTTNFILFQLTILSILTFGFGFCIGFPIIFSIKFILEKVEYFPKLSLIYRFFNFTLPLTGVILLFLSIALLPALVVIYAGFFHLSFKGMLGVAQPLLPALHLIGGFLGGGYATSCFKRRRKKKTKKYSKKIRILKDVDIWSKLKKRDKNNNIFVAMFTENKDALTLDDFIDQVRSKLPKEKDEKYDNIVVHEFYSFEDDRSACEKYNIKDDRDLAFVFFFSNGEIFSRNGKSSFYGNDIWDPNKYEDLLDDLFNTLEKRILQNEK